MHSLSLWHPELELLHLRHNYLTFESASLICRGLQRLRELAVSNITYYSMPNPGNSLKDRQSALRITIQLSELEAYDESPPPLQPASLFSTNSVQRIFPVRPLKQIGIDRSSFYKQVTEGLD